MMDSRIAAIQAPGYWAVEIRPGEPFASLVEFLEDDKVTEMSLEGVTGAIVEVIDPRTGNVIAEAETTLSFDGHGNAISFTFSFPHEQTSRIRDRLFTSQPNTTAQPQSPFGRIQCRLVDANNDRYTFLDGEVTLREVGR